MGIVFEKIPAFTPVQTIDSLPPLNLLSIALEETNPDTTKQTHPTIRLGDGRLLARGALRECPIRRALRGQRHSAEGGRTRKSHRGDQRGAHSGATHLEEDAQAGREGTGHFRDCFEEALPQLCDPPRLLYARLGRHLALQFYSLFQILCVGSLGLAAMAEARRGYQAQAWGRY